MPVDFLQIKLSVKASDVPNSDYSEMFVREETERRGYLPILVKSAN